MTVKIYLLVSLLGVITAAISYYTIAMSWLLESTAYSYVELLFAAGSCTAILYFLSAITFHILNKRDSKREH